MTKEEYRNLDKTIGTLCFCVGIGLTFGAAYGWGLFGVILFISALVRKGEKC